MGFRRRAIVPAFVAAPVAVIALTAAAALARPIADHEMPFTCHEEWYGSSRSYHSPSYLAIDWNRDGDLGRPIRSSAAGIVSRVTNLGGTSYGLYVIVDHGNGESTLYAHLQAEFVTVGQHLDQGELLGLVGTSGGSTGPHLHYEQRRNGTVQQSWFHDAAFPMGSTMASRNCPDTPIAGDWNGDDKAEVGVFRRAIEGRFRLRVAGTVQRATLGYGTATPLVGDWDGDGVDDVGIRRPVSDVFELRSSDGSVRQVRFGATTDVGVAGDWNGDGTTEVGVWRPSTATFLMRAANGTSQSVALGSVGSQPVTGDWNGDGRTDLGVFSAGTWRLWARQGSGTWTATIALGDSDDLPVTGHWNRDGVSDLGVWDPQTATFTLRKAAPMSTGTGRLVTRLFGRPR